MKSFYGAKPKHTSRSQNNAINQSQIYHATCKRCGSVKEEDIGGGSLNTIWAGGALRDTEVEVRCRGGVCLREAPRRGVLFLKTL